MTCSGVTGKKSPATSDWFQIVQINSVYAIPMFIAAFLCRNPQTLNGTGRQVLIDKVCQTDEWFTDKTFSNIACPWQIESFDQVDYH